MSQQETMNADLDTRIDGLLNDSIRMFLATSVDGMSSGSSVFFARDGEDLIFFTFHPTRKAEQVRANPRVQIVIWPKKQEGIRELQIDGYCYKITDSDEAARAKELILARTTAFKEFMEDEFLLENKVVGYYRFKPAVIKYVDFYAEVKFEWKEFPHNVPSPVSEFLGSLKRRIGLWLRAVRAPFFTASIIPVMLGGVIASGQLLTAGAQGSWDWSTFWLVIFGAILAQAGTNLTNDYFDHTSRNDEMNKVPSPFNGGSRMIQAGLMAPWKVALAAIISFTGAIVIGLELNRMITGAWFGNSPLLWIGVLGIALGALYTGKTFSWGYRGLGEPAIAIGFGPVMVLGTHFVLTAPFRAATDAVWAWQSPFLASLPVAILVMLIVWINQFQDAPADKLVGKNTWVVRLAPLEGGFLRYEKPFNFYAGFNYLTFAIIFSLGAIGFVRPDLATPFVWVALLPAILMLAAVKWGRAWMIDWNKPDGDRQKLPYMLLKVNVSTIAVHLFTGLLLVLGFWLPRIV